MTGYTYMTDQSYKGQYDSQESKDNSSLSIIIALNKH